MPQLIPSIRAQTHATETVEVNLRRRKSPIRGLENPLMDHYDAALRHLEICDPERFRAVGLPSSYGCTKCGSLLRREDRAHTRYSWAIPTEAALEMIRFWSSRA